MKRFLSYLHIVICLAAIASVIDPANAAESHLLATGQQAVIDKYGQCRVVTNTTGKTIYIPTKTASEWVSFYSNPPPNVSAPACVGCTLDGVDVAHGSSRTFYMATRSCHGTCGSISQVRNCYNGALDGSASYKKANCPNPTCASCTTANVNWATSSFTCTASAVGGSHGTSRNISDSASPSVGSATFMCDDGAWSKTSGSCAAASCARPWGGTVLHGSSITAYRYATASCGESCQPQTRTCNNGSLSGSYSNQSCSTATCANCSLAGVTVNHGASRTFYSSSSVACGGSCSGQSRTCNNGSLSGSASYNKASCSVAGCASCSLPWGGSISHGQSRTAYQNASVPCGSSCASQSRKCTNGSLSGSYTQQSCTVQSCASGTWTYYANSGCGTSSDLGNTCSGSCSPIGAECTAGHITPSNPCGVNGIMLYRYKCQ